jgi:hypothetical protein
MAARLAGGTVLVLDVIARGTARFSIRSILSAGRMPLTHALLADRVH